MLPGQSHTDPSSFYTFLSKAKHKDLIQTPSIRSWLWECLLFTSSSHSRAPTQGVLNRVLSQRKAGAGWMDGRTENEKLLFKGEGGSLLTVLIWEWRKVTVMRGERRTGLVYCCCAGWSVQAGWWPQLHIRPGPPLQVVMLHEDEI